MTENQSKIDIKNVTFGADPEFGILHKPTNKIVSGIGFVGGEKSEPLILDEETGITRTEDNVLFEAQFPPVNNVEDWCKMFRIIQEKGNELLSQFDMQLIPMSNHFYDDDQLEHPMARTFGCSASMNAYTKDVQYTCGPEEAGNQRSVGAHVHLGVKEGIDTEDNVFNLMKVFDIFLGVPSVLIDQDKHRRKLYGRAGECRMRVINDYVVMEYRTLGGNMLADEELIRWTYHQMEAAIDFFNQSNFDEIFAMENEIVDCINNCDEQLAQKLVKQFNISYPDIQVDAGYIIFHAKQQHA